MVPTGVCWDKSATTDDTMKLGRFSAIHAPVQRIYKRAVVASGPTPVLNLDAADYSAMPVNASTVAGSGAYSITVQNTNSRMSWNAANGGVFRIASVASNSTDFMNFGPNYSGTQAYTVGMAYKWNGVTAGRLLNANTASPDFLMGIWGSGTARMNIAFSNGFVGSSSDAADTAWHFIWFSSTGIAGAEISKSYIATSTAPTGTYGTLGVNAGFNGLRLFGRFSTTTTISEPVDADVGFVKVWDSALTLAQIQAEHATYKTRFGY